MSESRKVPLVVWITQSILLIVGVISFVYPFWHLFDVIQTVRGYRLSTEGYGEAFFVDFIVWFLLMAPLSLPALVAFGTVARRKEIGRVLTLVSFGILILVGCGVIYHTDMLLVPILSVLLITGAAALFAFSKSVEEHFDYSS